MKKAAVFISLALASVSSPALATWRVAESNNFTIYSESSEEELRQTIERMEKFDKILRVFSGTNKPIAKMKLTLFQMRDMDSVAATLPYETFGIGGFYTTSIRGPYLVATRKGFDAINTARTRHGNGREWGPEVVQHEYVHHFMYQYFPANYPSWYSEGFAEYFGTLSWGDDGSVELGHAPLGRMNVIRREWLPMSKLLTAKSYDDVGEQIGSLYAQGWLLTHYGQTTNERGAKVKTYLDALIAGTPYDEAARRAFGDDLTALDRELQAHARDLQALRIPLRAIDTGPIAIRTLNEAEESLLRADIRLHVGVERSNTGRFAQQIEEALVSEPGNIRGWEMLIEARRLDNDVAGARQAADRLLAADPQNGMAMFHKADMAIEALQAEKSTDTAAWDAARADIVEASRLRPNTPMIFEAYFDSYVAQGVTPPADAQNALMKALELIPQNSELRYKVAADFEQRGMYDDAIFMIKPEAFGSHEEDQAEKTRRERAMREAAQRYTGIEVREPALEFLARLERKKAEADGTATPAAEQAPMPTS